jgi:peptidylprolyl isomerase domain and WD repeat-containing protein 1
MDTDLYEYAKIKATVLSIAFSRDGKKMAVMSDDRKIRVFNFLTGKIVQTIDESLEVYSAIQQVMLNLFIKY